MRGIFDKMMDFVFPPRCPICDGILAGGEGRIHRECERSLGAIRGSVCLHCGRPVVSEQVEFCFDCGRKQKEGFAYEQGKGLFLYQGAMKYTMYRFKYSNKREYALFFSEYAIRELGAWMQKMEIEVIVPIPMYWKKKMIRGYNQAEIFAKELSRRTGIPIEKSWVVRNRNTRPMKNLNDRERKNNLKNAFHIRKNIVKYNKILLVDDIYTTGSTMDTVAQVLAELPCKKIYSLSICMGKGI